MATKEQNLEFLNNSVSTLDQIATNPSTPKNIRKNIADIVEQLKSDEYSVLYVQQIQLAYLMM